MGHQTIVGLADRSRLTADQAIAPFGSVATALLTKPLQPADDAFSLLLLSVQSMLRIVLLQIDRTRTCRSRELSLLRIGAEDDIMTRHLMVSM